MSERKEWKCAECGQVIASMLPPVKCPKCRAGWKAFGEA